MIPSTLTRHPPSARRSRTRGLGPITLAILVCIFASTPARTSEVAAAKQLPWANARQLMLVVAPDWNSSRAIMQTFERTDQGWRATSAGTPVVIGKSGSAWGVGLHPAQPGPQKHEGDGRSPAGVFALGTAFGYASSMQMQWPYAAMSVDDYCVDVASSPLYDRIVDAAKVGAAAVAGSTEPMRRDLHEHGDQAYKLGLVIEHNPRHIRGAGSCIFAHLWHSPDTGTAGCTAMAEPVLQAVLDWLRTEDNPVFVLLPREQYARLKSAWDLPDLALD